MIEGHRITKNSSGFNLIVLDSVDDKVLNRDSSLLCVMSCKDSFIRYPLLIVTLIIGNRDGIDIFIIYMEIQAGCNNLNTR